MENATQALFMAAGVLIAVMIISLGVYLFSSTSSMGESYERKLSENEMLKFNNKFATFNKTPKFKEIKVDTDEGIKTYKIPYNFNSISDVVSAINLAMDVNEKNNYDSQSGIIVEGTIDGKQFYLNTKNKLDGIDNNDLNVLLSKYSDNKLTTVNSYYNKRIYKYYFSGEVEEDDTGYIHKIKFTMNEVDEDIWNSDYLYK